MMDGFKTRAKSGMRLLGSRGTWLRLSVR
jgi:hypothetical protein